MNKFYYINEFAEGKLPGSLREKFLEELNSSGEMRSQLESLLKVNSSIKQHRREIAPPGPLKNKVFRELGIDTRGKNYTEKPAYFKGIYAGLFSEWRYRIVASIAVAALIACSVIAFRLVNPSGTPLVTESQVASAHIEYETPPALIPDWSESILAAMAAPEKEKNKIPGIKTSEAAGAPSINTPPHSAAGSKKQSEKGLSPSSIDNPKRRGLIATNMKYSQIGHSRINGKGLKLSGLNLEAPGPGGRAGISLEASAGIGIAGGGQPPVFSLADDLSVALFKNLSAGFEAGINFRKEKFSREEAPKGNVAVEGKKTDSEYITASLGLRYNFDSLSEDLPPLFVQGTYGLNKNGTVKRLEVGLKIRTKDSLTLIAGYELSRLDANKSHGGFRSDKSGINIGMAYQF